MMKNFIIYIALFLTFGYAGCGKPACVIQGKIESKWNGKTVYLQIIEEENMRPQSIDSTIINQGEFKFAQTSVSPQTALLSIIEQGKSAWTTQFILEEGNIKITSDSQGNTLIAGTPNNELLQQHFNRWYIPYNKMRQSSEEMYRLEQAGQLTRNTLDSLDKNSQSYMREMRLLSLEFVKENINNPAGKSLLMEIMGLPDRLLVDVVEKADSISLRHPLMQQISKRINTYKAVAVGKIFQDVIAVNMQDQPSRLSDYAGKGKYVLIDFWASWCKPCCIEMPELKQLYHQYKEKGLEIVSISIDQDKDAWQKKIKELQMNWPQMIDENKEASKTYVVGAIPHTILLDPTGGILAKDLRGKELEEKIAQYLK